jgi:two-component system LytT family response regulator
VTPLRVLVADDEAIARRRIVRLLGALPDVVVAGECASGEETLARVATGGVDVVLLDVQMPGLSGVEALGLLPRDGPAVVFCTAHPDHAVAAFDGGAADYLLKPIEAARLAKALERARERVERRRAPAPPPARLALPTRRGILLLDPADVSHAVLENELVTIHHTGGQVSTDLPLSELHARLPRMERVHRRVLLNLDHVTRLEPLETGGYIARTRAGAAVTVSRQAARELRRSLGLPGARAEEA